MADAYTDEEIEFYRNYTDDDPHWNHTIKQWLATLDAERARRRKAESEADRWAKVAADEAESKGKAEAERDPIRSLLDDFAGVRSGAVPCVCDDEKACLHHSLGCGEFVLKARKALGGDE